MSEYAYALFNGEKLNLFVYENADKRPWKKSITVERIECHVKSNPIIYMTVLDPYSQLPTEEGIKWTVNVPQQKRNTYGSGDCCTVSIVEIRPLEKNVSISITLTVTGRIQICYRDFFLRKHTIWLTPMNSSDEVIVAAANNENH